MLSPPNTKVVPDFLKAKETHIFTFTIPNWTVLDLLAPKPQGWALLDSFDWRAQPQGLTLLTQLD